MIGTIVQVNVSSGGIPKRAVPSAVLTEAGIAGDSWRYPFHGGRRKAVLLITSEGIDELVSQGFALFPGALGENFTTRGIDRRRGAARQRARHRFGRASGHALYERLGSENYGVEFRMNLGSGG